MKLLQAIDSLKEAAPIMLGAGFSGSFLLGYNPLHAVFGSLGQIIFLMANYVAYINKGEKAPSYPIIYWIAVILMGAIIAFMGVPQLVKFVGFEQYLLAFLVGALAQKFIDFINLIYKKYTKNEGLSEE
jgi:hypothetical protein